MTAVDALKAKRARLLAWGSAGFSVVLIGVAVLGAVAGGLSLADVVSGFVVTNVVMAMSFSTCGLILATQRPRNPIGWLFVLDGLGHALTAATVPLITVGLTKHWPTGLIRTITTVGVYAWPWSIGLFLPLALLLFPDGRPPARRWSWAMWAGVGVALLFVAESGTEPSSPVRNGPTGYLTIGDHDRFAVVWRVAELGLASMYAVSLIAMAVRYRRGGERERRQVLWLFLATLLTLGVLIPWGVLVVGPPLMLLAVPLIGVAVLIAILRHQLLDIRLVLSRAFVYLVLSGVAVLAFEVLVGLFDAILRKQTGLGTSVLATVLVAVGFNPARERLQSLLDRAAKAVRSRPSPAAGQPSGGPVDAAAGFDGVAEAMRSALDLPFVALRDAGGEVGACGTAPEALHVIPLVNGAERLGELVLGMRTQQDRPVPPDQITLDMLAALLTHALYATARCAESRRSRERIIVVREEERQRLRRDLDDGLWPMLTDLAKEAGLARELVFAEPTRAVEALTALQRRSDAIIEIIRRISGEQQA